MGTTVKKHEIDMLHGSIWNKLPLFALPVAATAILEQLFHASDVAIVGNFTGDARTVAVAAVGANGPIIGLIVNLFIGIALGANVVIANAIGCRDDNAVKRAVHTAIVFAVCGGAAVALLGQLIASPLLSILNVPEDVFPYALLYLRIYLLGMPVILLYNFEAAIFRSIGDTKVPLAALAISNAFGIAPTHFTFALTAAPRLLLLRVAALAAVCSLMSILFCVTMHGTERLFAGRIQNPWLRIAAGGAIVVVLTLLVGTGDYNGAGMDVITRAIEGGQAAPDAFFWKLLFTAVTIGSGFKGGEVVPTFFIGATLGCVLGGLLGIPAGFAAALGLVCVFCGAVNCPIASIVLSIELFGAGQLVYFALACGIAYMLSGYFGLYSSQKILYSKLRTEFINIHAK